VCSGSFHQQQRRVAPAAVINADRHDGAVLGDVGPVIVTSVLATGAPPPSALTASASDLASNAAFGHAACAIAGRKPAAASRLATLALEANIWRRVCTVMSSHSLVAAGEPALGLACVRC
jgi:hypothetical protein